MLKIGEFSLLGQVTVRTLRYYDELGLLKPVQIDYTNYRYYSIDQLPRLNRILALKDLGFSLEEIAQLLDEDLPAARLRSMLMVKQAEIEQQLQEGRARLERVEARLKQIEHEGKLSSYEVVLKQVESQMIASTRLLVAAIADMDYCRRPLFAQVHDWLAQQQIKPMAPELAIYHNGEYAEQDIDMEAAVVVNQAALKSISRPNAEVTIRELPAVQTMASVIHQGRLRDVKHAITALFTWIGRNDYSTSGSFREIHLFGREQDLIKDDVVVLEMQVPVERG